jgi:ubiquitin carboxyl-terminal hydrolase 7
LTASFGWDTLDSFMQHDVQEFNSVLQDNLETKMKGTLAEGAISRLFVGRMKSFIKCIDVDFESSRIKDFYDVQLNVKGCKDLNASFVDYCAIETLDGENQCQAEGFGFQDAKKGVVFKKFPPVLHLQLKRFEYDMEHDAMVKV